jgi:hypothetical protein
MSLLKGTATVPESHRQHRQAFKAFVEQETDAWQHSADAKRLYTLFDEWNAVYFDGRLTVPYLVLLEPSSPRRLGDTSSMSGWGGKLQIRLRPSLLNGTYPCLRSGEAFAEGRFLFVADVLLHEMIHHFHLEVTGDTEEAFHGHGPAFRDDCNRIGAALGLPPVRSAKKRGLDKDLPSCAQWPHNVRPPGYYLGAYVEPTPEPPVPPTPVKDCATCARVSPLIDRALLFMRSLTPTQRKINGVVGCTEALLAMRAVVPIIGDTPVGVDAEED